MKVFVYVKAGAKVRKVEKIDNTTYKVSVKSPPIGVKGKKSFKKSAYT